MAAEVPQFEVADGQSDDGGLVQLARDGAGQRQHLRQLVEFIILLAAPRPRRVAWLLLADLQDAAIKSAKGQILIQENEDLEVSKSSSSLNGAWSLKVHYANLETERHTEFGSTDIVSALRRWKSCLSITGFICSKCYQLDILMAEHSLVSGKHHDMETVSILLSFVRRIDRSPVSFHPKGSVMQSFDVFFIVCLNKLLNKQSTCHDIRVTSM